ncbi:MAG: isocitrate lyase/phosphoenolpyruvate mutase family protein [Bacteroidetes bacterium]|nr:isocitrate lyase/phosphoenolpyruvate mutase family protein [Bacteroidota bacterium]
MTTLARLQREQEQQFHRLHHSSETLILPNIWDPLGALLLAEIGYPAVATSSAAIAWSQGYPDGERIPFNDLLGILKRIVDCVQIPVSADIERAYAGSEHQLREHIRLLLDTGIAGINYEDSQHDQPALIEVDEQCRQIEIIRETALKCGSELFINARIDVYIKAAERSREEQLAEALKRGKAYRDAGADGLYPIILNDEFHIKMLVQETNLPFNITLLPGGPGPQQLAQWGVARLSLASGFLKSSIASLKHIAEGLIQHQDETWAMHQMASADYLRHLVAQARNS